MMKSKNKYSSAYNRANNERWKKTAEEQAKQNTKPKRKYKPLPLGIIALRNFCMFVVVMALLISFLLIGGNDLTAFYNEKHFEKHAEVTSEFVEQEGKWVDWTEHIITVKHVSKRYQYAAAVIDFSEYETDKCYSGTVRFDDDAVSNRQQLEHILILNPVHAVDNRGSLLIYTDDEEFNKAYGYRSAEEFYKLQEQYEQEHATIFAIMQNDFDHIMYNLVQGSGMRWIVPIVLLAVCVVYAIWVYKRRSDYSSDGLSTITILWAASMIATSIGMLGLALVGGDMAADGGVGGVVVAVVAITTGLCALLFAVSMLLPLLLDVDFIYGFSTFWIKAIASCVVAVLVFGIGVMLEELMEVYTIFHTATMIVLVTAAFVAFFAFAGLLYSRSIIFRTYMDISVSTLEFAEQVGNVWLIGALAWQVEKLDTAIGTSAPWSTYELEKEKKRLEESIASLEQNIKND